MCSDTVRSFRDLDYENKRVRYKISCISESAFVVHGDQRGRGADGR